MLPSSSWTIAMVRMFWLPLECWVHPSAYIEVCERSGVPVEAINSHAFTILSFGDPVIRDTMSTV